MSTWVWAAGAIVATALLIHPVLTYPLSLLLLMGAAKKSPGTLPPAAQPTLALCMSVFNEERVIVAKVEQLLDMAQSYGPATVHIYVDGSTDRTTELLRLYEDRVDLVIGSQRRGKTAGLNILIQRSESELLAFTDANVVAEPDALIKLAAPFANPEVGCTTARLIYTNDRESPTSTSGSLYWRIEETIKRLENRTVGVIGVDGAMFLARRRDYEPAPDDLIDDLYVSLLILAKGSKVQTIEDVVVYERAAVHWREEFRRKQRIACQAMNVHRALWPRLRRMPLQLCYAYVSHRLLKWLAPLFLILALVFGFTACASAVGIVGAAQIFLIGAALIGLGAIFRVRLVLVALSAFTSVVGVGLGVAQSWFDGRTYSIWQPARSVRD